MLSAQENQDYLHRNVRGNSYAIQPRVHRRLLQVFLTVLTRAASRARRDDSAGPTSVIRYSMPIWRAMKAGAIDFSTEPVSDNDLLGAIVRAEQKDAKSRKVRSEMASIQSRIATLTPR
ncbi:MAG: hypothetical protein JWQ49_2403 [Edaphobacter sp.]|nr:hypothetical protein [Edaphobacter sp.]